MSMWRYYANRRACAAVLVLLAAGSPLLAHAADVPFTYRRGGLPDFDQRRESVGGHYGLPGDGLNFCVPSSGMNCLAFIANHGYGWIEPFGFTNWSNPGQYDSAGIEIFKLGNWFMNTDPATGTTGNDHVQGLKDWLDSWGVLSDFTVNGQFADGAYCPNPNELADAALQGGLVMPLVGWYSLMAGAYTRVGGHALVMNKLVGTAIPGGAAYTISWRDPASDDGAWDSQSPFSTETYALTPITAMFDGNNRTQFRVEGFTSGGNAGFLAGFVVITPKYALTSAPGDFQFDLYSLSSLAGAPTHALHVAAEGGIRRAALRAGSWHAAYLTLPDGNYRSQLRLLDPFSGVSQLVVDEIDDALSVAVSRHNVAYVLGSSGLTVEGVSLDPNVAQAYSTLAPQYMNTLAYDDRHDRLYLLGTLNTRMVAFSADLATQTEIYLPWGLSMNAEAPMFVSPVTSNIWIASTWASALYELGVDESGVATLLNTVHDPALADVQGLSVDDQDHVFVSTASGYGLEFAPDGLGGFARLTNSVLDGFPVGTVLQLSYSRSNFDPATMTTPAYDELWPTEFAPPEYDLIGDLNCDQAVDFGDINPFVRVLLYPDQYLVQHPDCQIENGDINQDGLTDFADINPFVDILMGGGVAGTRPGNGRRSARP